MVRSRLAIVYATKASRRSSTQLPIDEGIYTGQAMPGSSFAIVNGADQYNWNTKGLKAGFTYRIGPRLDDGTTQYVYVGLR